MQDLVAKRFFITGRVQGVFFRASTRQIAQQFGVNGFARNLADGRVEVLAIGASTMVDQLESWLWQGPPSAQVTAVEACNVAFELVTEYGSGFTTC